MKSKILDILNYKSNPIVSFATRFLILMIIFLIGIPIQKHIIPPLYQTSGEIWFDNFVNNDTEMNRNVSFAKGQSEYDILVNISYLDKFDANHNNIVKYVGINTLNECYIPVCFLLSLVIALPYSKKNLIKASIWAYIIAHTYVVFKLFTIIYDNYSYPEYALSKLPFGISSIVYFYNWILTETGNNTAFLIPIFVALIIAIKFADRDKLVIL